jgi:hypothetical protein
LTSFLKDVKRPPTPLELSIVSIYPPQKEMSQP